MKRSLPTLWFAHKGNNPSTWDALLMREILYKIAINKEISKTYVTVGHNEGPFTPNSGFILGTPVLPTILLLGRGIRPRKGDNFSLIVSIKWDRDGFKKGCDIKSKEWLPIMSLIYIPHQSKSKAADQTLYCLMAKDVKISP